MHVTQKNLSAEVVSFSYLNNTIRFKVNGCVMINATNMAKPFAKVPKDWLRTKAAKKFIRSFSAVRQICLTELIKLVQGGNAQLQGTWMQEDVALEFARWLSPEFAIWCNDRIKELMTTGVTSLRPDLNEAIKTLTAENTRLKGQLEFWQGHALWSSGHMVKQAEQMARLVERL